MFVELTEQRRAGMPRVQGVAWQRDLAVAGALSLSAVGYLGWFLVLHLRSVGWAPGQVLDWFPGYWSWFYGTFFSANEVYAVRRSQLAARHPLYQMIAIALLAAGYVWLLLCLRRGSKLALKWQLLLASIFGMPLLVAPNLMSADIYSYISFGRIAAIYGANPFIDPPATFPSDQFFHLVGWTGVPSVYGPGWIYPSMLLTLLVQLTKPGIITYVLAYKTLALLLHLINGVLIWRILGALRPRQQTWGTALYLFNPLTVIEFAGSGHNDVLMITLILLAMWLHVRGRWRGAMIALTLSVLVKWIALPVAGLYGLLLLWEAATWSQRLRKAVESSAIFVMLCVALYAPYWESTGPWDGVGGRHTLKILFDAPPQKRFINSLGELAVGEYGRVMSVLGQWPDQAVLGMNTTLAYPMGRLSDDNTDRDSWQAQQRLRYSRYIRDQYTQRTQLLEDQKMVQDRIRNGALSLLALVSLGGVIVTRNLKTLMLASAWILFTYCAIAAVWVWPWYATWFVAMAALLDWRVTGRTAVLVGVLALLLYPLFPIMPEPSLLERYRALLVFGLPTGFACVAAIKAWQQRVTQRRAGNDIWVQEKPV
ncbi:MAG: hypothetical protein NVS4B8_14480 [Herpetosiphon sp.]